MTRSSSARQQEGGLKGSGSIQAEAAGDQLREELRRRLLRGPLKVVFVILTLAAVLLAVNQLFLLRPFGVTLLDTQYLYLLAGVFLALSFLVFPAWPSAPLDRVPWYDLVLALLVIGVSGYFVATAERALLQGWEYAAPERATLLSYLYWALILEGARRAGGFIIFFVCLLFSLYPTIADSVPGPISGFPQPIDALAAIHILSSESAFGIPMRAFGQLVIGFIVFGAALQYGGGGRFFNDLALGLVGGLRGGAAKVAIFASGFMGSMSGSVISNVLTTGVVSIPAMKRSGFSARYAAGTEACASTGGVLMPPVMGATAFVMASFLGRPYVEIMAAAAIPSALYYFGLFVQLDAYAARRGLRGLPRHELPSLRTTFRNGWQYLVVFAVLIFFMVALRQETLAPFYATALLLIINQLRRTTRLSFREFIDMIAGIGRALAELVAILLGVGLIVGAFSATGLAGTLVNDLVFIAGRETLPLLLMGALTAFVFGMGMTVTACYIFLAVVLAPALVSIGLDPLAVHLFILYWGMVSFITPPVSLGAFAAATLAGTSPMAAGIAAMRLGAIIYIIPFFFVLNPALIGQGSFLEVVTVLATAIIGVWFIASALQGYIPGIGLIGSGVAGRLGSFLLFLAGIAFAAPGGTLLGLSHLQLVLAGLAMAAPVLAFVWLGRGKAAVA
ncbi:MAG TPA: TRAP transporter fused permease subunit [Kiloniellales bacterium]|nr:TRAP transporter fused permease subunit [Kiloniellales bacterium]